MVTVVVIKKPRRNSDKGTADTRKENERRKIERRGCVCSRSENYCRNRKKKKQVNGGGSGCIDGGYYFLFLEDRSRSRLLGSRVNKREPVPRDIARSKWREGKIVKSRGDGTTTLAGKKRRNSGSTAIRCRITVALLGDT